MNQESPHTPASAVETWAQRLAGGPHIAGAVYGTIIAMAVMGAWLADPTSGAWETLASVAATLVVFWIAHVYAHMVGHGLGEPGGVLQELKHALQHDWPIVQAGLLPALVLAVGGLEWVSERLAMKVAIGTSGAVLLALSVAMSRAAGRSWGTSWLLALLLGGLGVLVAVLEVMLG